MEASELTGNDFSEMQHCRTMRGESVLKQAIPMIYSASFKFSERPGLKGLWFRKTEQNNS